jgi:hypothetical protein
MKLENEKQKIDDFFNNHTDAEIKAKFDKYSWQNKPKKKFFIYGVGSSKIKKKTIGFWIMIISLVSMLLLLMVFKDKQLFAIMYLPFVIGLLMYGH